MKNIFITSILIGGFLITLSSCEKKSPDSDPIKNPFTEVVDWNGFILSDQKYVTPKAIVEIWGVTDSLSADFDVSLTDGSFDSQYRVISDYNIMVYFDVNSPLKEKIEEGIYYIENTSERKPNIINNAYIIVVENGVTTKYPIIEGQVKVEEENAFFLVDYQLKTVKDKEIVDITGKYTGTVIPYDQSIKDRSN